MFFSFISAALQWHSLISLDGNMKAHSKEWNFVLLGWINLTWLSLSDI